MLKITFSLLLFLLLACTQKTALEKVAGLPKEIEESSGMAYDKNLDAFWTIQDANNAPLVYRFDKAGNLEHKIKVTNVKNNDWEALLFDSEGNLYIGDFGNNTLKKNRYKILKINGSELHKENVEASIITFNLNGKKEKDFEAFILKNDFFYLFSKEKRQTTIYKLPNVIGKQKAQKQMTHTFSKKGRHPITDAILSPDNQSIALLNHDKIWFLSDFITDDFFSGIIHPIPLGHTSQKEGICFFNSSTVYITDERTDNNSGYLYTLKIKP